MAESNEISRMCEQLKELQAAQQEQINQLAQLIKQNAEELKILNRIVLGDNLTDTPSLLKMIKDTAVAVDKLQLFQQRAIWVMLGYFLAQGGIVALLLKLLSGGIP